MGKMIDAIEKLLSLECQTGHLGPRPSKRLMFTLSSKAYRQLNEECDAKRLGTRPCEIHTFCSELGKARILEDEQQTDDILAYYRFS